MAASLTELLKVLAIAAAEFFKMRSAQIKVENYREDLKDDEFIQEQLDMAAADPRTAAAHNAAAQLRQQQKVGRHELQRISPL